MGFFKDLRDMKKMADEIQEDNPRPGFREMMMSQARKRSPAPRLRCLPATSPRTPTPAPARR